MAAGRREFDCIGKNIQEHLMNGAAINIAMHTNVNGK